MKIFFDTELIESVQNGRSVSKSGVRGLKPAIDLISIGMVNENGDEYYAVSSDFNVDFAWSDEWIKQNVLLPIYEEFVKGDERLQVGFNKKDFKSLILKIGKPNKRIASEVLLYSLGAQEDFDDWLGSTDEFFDLLKEEGGPHPEFYAYCASYDWVVFCWLFGRMIELPKQFPMYCTDLKNLMDFKGLTKDWKRTHCPDQENVHNALADAKWNKGLYEAIQRV